MYAATAALRAILAVRTARSRLSPHALVTTRRFREGGAGASSPVQLRLPHCRRHRDDVNARSSRDTPWPARGLDVEWRVVAASDVVEREETVVNGPFAQGPRKGVGKELDAPQIALCGHKV
jgi:hypothetical protein